MTVFVIFFKLIFWVKKLRKMHFSNSGLNLQMQTVILLVFFFFSFVPPSPWLANVEILYPVHFFILSVTPFWHKSIKHETLTVGRTATLPNSTFMIGVCLPLPPSPQLDGNSSFSHNAAILLRATRCPSTLGLPGAHPPSWFSLGLPGAHPPSWFSLGLPGAHPPSWFSLGLPGAHPP